MERDFRGSTPESSGDRRDKTGNPWRSSEAVANPGLLGANDGQLSDVISRTVTTVTAGVGSKLSSAGQESKVCFGVQI